MHRSIVISCDTYYYQLGNEMGIDAIHDFMKPFGFGQITGIDLLHEKTGVLPSKEWKRERFKKNKAMQKWVGGDTISISIGQGFNNYTMLQLAHAVANLANNGVVMKPHLVKIIEDGATRARTLTVPKESARIPLKQENIDFIKRAMVGVTPSERHRRIAFANAGYMSRRQDRHRAGGRPEAAANTTPSHDAERLRDNALYIGFAPADKPRIAIAVVVENAGFGAAVAAPIVRKALDYYLLGKRPATRTSPRCRKEDAELVPLEETQDRRGGRAPYKPGAETPGNKD
jgi:penicillin-binding protein 2